MENGVFISLAGLVYTTSDSMMTATILGLICTPILFIIMPIRALRTMSNGFTRDASHRNNLYKLAWAFLAIACYGLGELIFIFVSAKAGEVNGMMIPMLTVLPTVPYIGFEICYAMSRSGGSEDMVLDKGAN
jgi:hypothetical protein